MSESRSADQDGRSGPARPVLRLGGARQAPPRPATAWKCKPCGTRFEPLDSVEDRHVRCPSCRARLGLLVDFQSDPPLFDKLRARQVELKPVAPAAPKALTVQIKRRSSLRDVRR